mmetsp:Transcript_30635/g.78204  ORF Transcript_30635/g.78204 Transcript_30635/m.78204 type:complete len:148 (-) Transcript_30635:494-937(-)|eukprot:CAMPEP_0202868188 /NCGR_PEP_ID=MMETSP1391-20130828/10410_1 /ASSEMBLY_ACC=CAM_ASM_000867 /TAXON_ID=1034604 /ORGANISM="Chlamydomonas leiostraca, Strain SAG 11-49" /LENGTH=147 /DNA_ID=CAMNT_0049548317 /DNA_START=45 /DNA_END=488 /DNA_ORIENTATION=+
MAFLVASKAVAAVKPVTRVARAVPAVRAPVVQRRDVSMRFNLLGLAGPGKNPASAGSKRADYGRTDVTDYFEVGGFLAAEGDYTRVDAMLKTMEPIDVLLYLAASEGDSPFVSELLAAGANPKAKCPEGKDSTQVAKGECKAQLAKH